MKHGEVRLGSLDEWALILECPTGIYFDGIEGIARALEVRVANPPRFEMAAPPAAALMPQIAAAFSDGLYRYQPDPWRAGPPGLVPVLVRCVAPPMLPQAQFTWQWLEGRKAWLRPPDWRGSPVDLTAALETDGTEPELALFGIATPHLVIEAPTRIRIGGQVGGMACENPRPQGFAIPLPVEPWIAALGRIYHRHNQCGISRTAGREMIPVLAEAWPDQEGAAYRIELNREQAGTEAWFPVVLRSEQDSWAAWLDGYTGWILMPDNCD